MTAPPDYQIVLSIDEAIRVGQITQQKKPEKIDEAAPKQIYKMLERCNRLMGPDHPYLWVLATSLEINSLIYVQNGMTSTTPGRPIQLVQLHRPTMDERLKLFSKYASIKDLELLLVYSGGHWRTLKAIHGVLYKNSRWKMTNENLNGILHNPILISPGRTPVSIWNDLVKLALLADKVSVDLSVQGKSIHHLLRIVPFLNLLSSPILLRIKRYHYQLN